MPAEMQKRKYAYVRFKYNFAYFDVKLIDREMISVLSLRFEICRLPGTTVSNFNRLTLSSFSCVPITSGKPMHHGTLFL